MTVKPVAFDRIDDEDDSTCGRTDDAVSRDTAHTPSEVMAIAAEALHRVPDGLALKLELDTYMVLDDRADLGGRVLLRADEPTLAALGNQPLTMRVEARPRGSEAVVWQTTLRIDPCAEGEVAFTLPVASLGGYYTLTLTVQTDVPASSRHDRRQLTFARRQYRAAPPPRQRSNEDYLSFVHQTVATLIERQSMRAGGTLYLTVSGPSGLGYRSLGHKHNGKYATCWFPETPFELETFRPDIDLWPTLIELSRQTGEARYAKMVDDMAAMMAPHAFDPASGLMYFSEESDLDPRSWRMRPRSNWIIPRFKPRNTCERGEMPMAWLWRHAPRQTQRAMRSVYYGLITDPQRMDYNRFCYYGWDDRQRKHSLTPNASHCAFNTAGARMIAWWCEAYARTGDAEFLDWGRRMTAKWAAVQHEQTGLMPNFFGAAAHAPHSPQQPGQWAETRGTSLTALTWLEASEALAACEDAQAAALRAQLRDMAVRAARGVARFAYDPQRRIYREYLHLDGRPFEGTARYTFATQAEKDEAVRTEPMMKQVAVYDGTGFFRNPPYYAHIAGSNIPGQLAQIMARIGDGELVAPLTAHAADGVKEAMQVKGPFTADGRWTFHASARLISVLTLLHRATGVPEHLDAARRIANRELAALASVQAPDWWRTRERTALLDSLLLLTAEGGSR